MKIYTRTGDAGTTSLVGGSRVSKSSVRLEAYGTVDELNSHLGFLASYPLPLEMQRTIGLLQSRLFDLGAYLATPSEPVAQPQAEAEREMAPDSPEETPSASVNPSLLILDTFTTRLEQEMDAMEEHLPQLRSFILPGGCPAACEANIARTVCRRAERRVLALGAEYVVAPEAIRLLNRLSDYLFVAARFLNHEAHIPETPWAQ